MIASKLARLAELQEIPWRVRTLDQTEELNVLRRELAIEQQEKPDDPRTLLTDESSRPNLDGSNYNDTLHRMTCDELGAILERVGRVGFEMAVAAVLKR